MVRKLISNKKGWLRIVEAFFAVMLVLSVLVSVYVKNVNRSNEDEIYRIEKNILDEIANDKNLRKDILSGNVEDVQNFVIKRVPNVLNISVKICDVNEVCVLDNYDIYNKYEIYASERIISATFTQYKPKVVKIFIWQEK